MIAQAVCCTVLGTMFTYCNVNGSPEVVQCSGPWRKLDIILKTREPTTKEANTIFGKANTKFNRIQQDYVLAMYTLYFLCSPFPLIQDDLRELLFHTSIPQMDWEMLQQIRGRVILPLLGSSTLLELINANLDSLNLKSPFLETQSHAIKHDHATQLRPKCPFTGHTAQLGMPGMKEHAQHSNRGYSPPNTEKSRRCKATVARGG